MGSGASKDLTSDQKAEVSQAVQGKYRELTTKSNGDDGSSDIEGGSMLSKDKDKDKDIELFKTLSTVYEEKVTQIANSSSKNGNQLHDSNNEILSPSKMLEKFKNIQLDEDDEEAETDNFTGGKPFESSPKVVSDINTPTISNVSGGVIAALPKKRPSFRDVNRRPSFDIDTEFDVQSLATDVHINAQSTADLLKAAEQQANESAARLSTFIAGLKEQNQETKASDFRARRLTFGTKTEMKPEPGANRRETKGLQRKRTSIFSSSEIGVKQEKKPPFPDGIFGTYSCHGIEPDPQSDTGTHEKINQDRGCVVHPFNSQPTESLFMVLDGHGEQGEQESHR